MDREDPIEFKTRLIRDWEARNRRMWEHSQVKTPWASCIIGLAFTLSAVLVVAALLFSMR